MEEILHAKWSRQTASEWVEWSGGGKRTCAYRALAPKKTTNLRASRVCVCSRTLNVSSSLVAVVVVVVVFVIVLTATSSSGS